MDDRAQVQVETREEWRAWLERHHLSSPGVWVVTWRKGSGRPVVAYDDLVEEAIAVGWVDSRPGRVDDARTRLYVSPRKRGSNWSRSNKERVARLEREGRMAPAGREAVAAARADGSWTRLDAVEDLVVPDDLAAALAEHPGGRDHWDAFPPSARRGILEWIVSARRPATRAARVAETARLAARGERANQWRPR